MVGHAHGKGETPTLRVIRYLTPVVWFWSGVAWSFGLRPVGHSCAATLLVRLTFVVFLLGSFQVHPLQCQCSALAVWMEYRGGHPAACARRRRGRRRDTIAGNVATSARDGCEGWRRVPGLVSELAENRCSGTPSPAPSRSLPGREWPMEAGVGHQGRDGGGYSAA